jgi:ferrous iron transport protein B
MAARSIEDRKTKLITILVTPFMSCSARLPIYTLFASVFFVGYESLAIMSMYVLGMVVAFVSALALRKAVFGGESLYIVELPPFRKPLLRDVWVLSWSRTKHFLEKAGTIILLMSVVVWYLTNFPSGDIRESYAGMLGKALMPVFTPFGWGWECVVAVIMGFVAKEVVVETFGILLGNSANVSSLLSVPQAFAFMVFVSLYVPCVATVATIKAETNWRVAAFSVMISLTVAYVAAYMAMLVLEVVF